MALKSSDRTKGEDGTMDGVSSVFFSSFFPFLFALFDFRGGNE